MKLMFFVCFCFFFTNESHCGSPGKPEVLLFSLLLLLLLDLLLCTCMQCLAYPACLPSPIYLSIYIYIIYSIYSTCSIHIALVSGVCLACRLMHCRSGLYMWWLCLGLPVKFLRAASMLTPLSIVFLSSRAWSISILSFSSAWRLSPLRS